MNRQDDDLGLDAETPGLILFQLPSQIYAQAAISGANGFSETLELQEEKQQQ